MDSKHSVPYETSISLKAQSNIFKIRINIWKEPTQWTIHFHFASRILSRSW